jgi:hypothetical protein
MGFIDQRLIKPSLAERRAFEMSLVEPRPRSDASLNDAPST